MSYSVLSHATYVYKSPLNIQRYFITSVVNKKSSNKFELIRFDSDLVLLMHYYFDHLDLNIQCIKSLSAEISMKFGNAYKYWYDKSSLLSCAIAPTSIFSTSNASSTNDADLNIIALPVPNEIKPDLHILGNSLVQEVFKLIPLTEFEQAHPKITKLLKRHRRLIVGQDEYTFQLFLIIKGINNAKK